MAELPPPKLVLDDVALMTAIKAQDRSALQQLYDRHSGAVFTLALRMLHDRSEAEQLLVDVFFEVWQRFDRYDAARANPLTYLMRLTRSRAIDRLRSREKLKLVPLESGGINDIGSAERPDDGLLMDERRKMVSEALAVLEPSERRVIESAYYDGLSHSQIAEKFQKPLGSVKSTIRLGLVRLREFFAQRRYG